jgi:pyruvate-ferredoxin/flavodoxin oxidoreductase
MQGCQEFPFPGIPSTADGSEAVVWLEINMEGRYQTAVANGQPNLWGEPLAFLELESEHSSASTCTYYRDQCLCVTHRQLCWKTS